MVTVLELAVDTDHLPRYNMRRAASRPPPAARPRVLAKPQTESTLVQTTPSSAASLLLEVDAAPIRRYKTRGVTAVTALAAPPSTGGPNTRASDVMSAAAGWSLPLQPQGAYPEVPILAPPPAETGVEEVKNPSEAGGPAPPGSSPPSLPLGARPSTAGESTAPPLPLAFSHLRRPWERTDQQVEQGVAATEWRALAHSQVCTPGPIPNPNSHPHRPPCTAICTLHTPSAPSSTDPYPNSHPHHPPCTRC